ncbi:hypothetical protein [uncultured Xanthomonas sp.]|uniref:hypothetical protein n=1 Tax=uncultured Xanthomonas sp. TaxID=152831 RepID=UPI0025FF68B3|nr:hypothetical protein [uncultured Xanthomonas sp.]
MIRWYLTLLVSLYFLSQPRQPASATLFFVGLCVLCGYRLGGNKIVRLLRMRARSSRRRAARSTRGDRRG